MPTSLRRLFAIIVFAPIAFLIMINVHEIGHTLLARALGDEDAAYYIYKQFDVDKACIGCNIYDERKLSAFGNMLVTLMGVLFSQLVVLVLAWVWSRGVRLQDYRHLLVTAIIVFALDVPFQVFRGIQADVAGQAGLVRIDLADFVFLLHRAFAIPVDVSKIGLFVIAITYCLLLFRAVRRWHARPSYAKADSPNLND
jgi:hypothetical protein